MERAQMRAKCSYRLAASTASGKHVRRLPRPADRAEWRGKSRRPVVKGKGVVGFVQGIFITVGAIYLAVLGYLWTNQRSFVFRPGIGPLDLINSTVASYMREETIRTSDGLALT